jgi:hypothetical protein
MGSLLAELLSPRGAYRRLRRASDRKDGVRVKVWPTHRPTATTYYSIQPLIIITDQTPSRRTR